MIAILVGHPNSGKTSLFNSITGLCYKIVNYPGSTVDYAVGVHKETPDFFVVDTPGALSLMPRSSDEEVTIQLLQNCSVVYPNAPMVPDVVIVVVDITQCVRQLPLVFQLRDAGFKMVVALTMMDSSFKKGMRVRKKRLSAFLGCPVVSVNGRTGKGVSRLAQECQKINGQSLSRSILFPKTFSEHDLMNHFRLSQEMCQEVITRSPFKLRFDLDKVMLHPKWGFLIFGGVMSLFFWAIFAIAAPLMDSMDAGFSFLISYLNGLFPENWVSRLLTEGILTSLAAIWIFVPQIAILFFLIGFFEGSGYLARGAALIDKPLSAIGLNGRSFVPLLSGCACAIPAMLACRSIPGKKERLITLFVIPLMTCSARLPVYGLLIALLMGANHPIASGFVMTGIYFLSITLTCIVAKIAGAFIAKDSPKTGFHIELPEWRFPVIKHIFFHAYHQTKTFIFRAGPTIFIVGIALWLLTQLPSPDNSIGAWMGKWMAPVLSPMGVDWRVGFALLAAFAAREVFVSALTVVFSVSAAMPDSLLSSLRTATFEGTSRLIFSPPTILALIIFFMVSMQCMSTWVVAKKEMGGWKLPLIMTSAYISGAYVLAVGVYQLLTRYYLPLP